MLAGLQMILIELCLDRIKLLLQYIDGHIMFDSYFELMQERMVVIYKSNFILQVSEFAAVNII